MDPESFQKSTWCVFPQGLKIHVCDGWRKGFDDDDVEQAVQAFREKRPPRRSPTPWAWEEHRLGRIPLGSTNEYCADCKKKHRILNAPLIVSPWWACRCQVPSFRVGAPTSTRDDDDGDNNLCTYVALDIEEMAVKLCSDKWVVLRWKHHITLAYLPRIIQNHKLSQDLTDTMQNWIDTRQTPHLMPIRLLYFRTCRCYKDSSSEDLYMPLVELKPEELQREMELGTIALSSTPPAGEEENHAICRLYNRDVQRIADAPTGVAVSVGPDGRQPPITMQLSEGRVCANSEISTLLFYLRDRLIYRFGVFHMEGHVGLHHENSWHVTPQTENFNHEDMVRCEQVDDETARWLESPTSGRSPASG